MDRYVRYAVGIYGGGSHHFDHHGYGYGIGYGHGHQYLRGQCGDGDRDDSDAGCGHDQWHPGCVCWCDAVRDYRDSSHGRKWKRIPVPVAKKGDEYK
jgi:hypothetical protein